MDKRSKWKESIPNPRRQKESVREGDVGDEPVLRCEVDAVVGVDGGHGFHSPTCCEIESEMTMVTYIVLIGCWPREQVL